MGLSPSVGHESTGAPTPSGLKVSLKRLIAGCLGLVSGILFGISAATSWWTVSIPIVGGGSASLSFLPGSSYLVSGIGTSGSFGYAAAGLGPVGAMYEGVLAVAIVLLIVSLILGTLAILGALGKAGSTNRFGMVRGLLIALFVLSLFVVILVPAAQPSLLSSSGGGCSGFPSGTNPCGSFWGSGGHGENSYSWGSDVGWYLAVTGVVLMVAALAVWISSSAEPWGGGSSPAASSAAGALPGTPSPAPTAADLDRLLQLKQLVDSGHLSAEEFQQVKARILGTGGLGGPSTAGSAADELSRLRSLHDSGILTDSEYEELRKLVVSRP